MNKWCHYIASCTLKVFNFRQWCFRRLHCFVAPIYIYHNNAHFGYLYLAVIPLKLICNWHSWGVRQIRTHVQELFHRCTEDLQTRRDIDLESPNSSMAKRKIESIGVSEGNPYARAKLPKKAAGNEPQQSLKYYIWELLAESPHGMTAEELLHELQSRNLRSFEGSKKPLSQASPLFRK